MMTTMLGMAKRAGISKATVFHVLSGNSYVNQKAKDRVFQVIEEGGYHPNLLARNLSAKNIQTLGLVMTNTLYHGIYFSELLFHAARMAGEGGRQLLLAGDKHSAGEERQTVQYLLDSYCDVIMIYPRFLSMDEIDGIIDAYSQPIVVLNRHLRKNNSHSVWCGRKQISFNAVAELINAGHQEIVFLTGSIDSPISIERPIGYKDALAQHGIAPNEKLIANGKWTPASGAEGIEMLLGRGAKFSVLVASNDDMMIGAMKALHERGVAVPEQVSIVGFNDTATAPYIIPALSSVKIPMTKMIQETIRRLIFMPNGGDFSPLKTFSRKLIRRGSLITLSQ